MVIQFWGVRGTLPVPGKKTIRYGGNTSCVSLQIGKEHLFIFDAGTGIKELSNHLMKKKQFPLKAKIFITHPHYDHIHGIPFFAPLYGKGNEFEIFGTNQYDFSIGELVSNQMDKIYFPITIKEFSATLSFRNLTEEEFLVDGITVKTILLNHPGRCLGFRVEYKKKSFCYITDNELYLEGSKNYNSSHVEHLVNFIKEADVVVMDATYTDEQYETKEGWGHSCVSSVMEVANKAKVKKLCLFHHDPSQLDKDISLKLKEAKSILKTLHSKTKCLAPCEGDKLVI